MVDRTPVAARMLELRKKARLRQKHVAKVLGISQTSYSELETGEREPIRAHFITLAQFYGMPLAMAFPMWEDPVPNVVPCQVTALAA